MSAEPLRVGVNARIMATPSLRGLTRYASSLLRALSRRDDVELVLFAREPLLPEHMAGVRARVVHFDAAREFVWDDWLLPRRIRDEGVAVFHALADRGLPLVKPCPMVLTLHSSYERAHWRSLFQGVKRRLWYWKHELVNARRADVVVTVSDTTRSELAARGVCAASKLARVYLGAGTEFAAGAERDDGAVRERHGIEGRYFLFVGGYDPHKNVDALVRAFDAAAVSDHTLVVVASRSGGDAARRRWRQLACWPRLRLVEATAAELPALYRGATALVHPSLWESFGLQLVEAMACGLPVLASNRGAMPEIVGDAGRLFDPGDEAGLSAMLRQVTRDEYLRAELRRRGLARAASFSWDAAAAETVAIYRKALAA